MRFLHLNHRYHPFTGGSELYIKEISEYLASLGHEVTIVTSMASDLEFLWDRRKRMIDAPAYEMLNGVYVLRLPVGRFPGQRLLTPVGRRAMGELSRFARTEPVLRYLASRFPKLEHIEESLASNGAPDAVLATNLGLEGLALAGLQLARTHDVPFVLIPFAHVGDASDLAARRYVSMPHQVALLRAADLVLTLTDYEARFIAGLGVAETSIRTISCGTRESDVTGGCGARLRERLRVAGTLVGALGALAPEKGTPDLVRAVGMLRRRGVTVDLVLAGPVMTAFKRWWQRLPRAQREGIHLLGMIDQQEKRDFLDAVDIYAMPSRTESFGIVYLEAWLNGKPVVAARAGAVPEVVIDGENGLLVEFGDVEQLANAIARLSGDPRLRDRLGDQGRARARSNYTWDEVHRRFQDAYAEVLGIDVGRVG